MQLWVEDEPEISFGKGSRHVDPRAGLAQFGPFLAGGQAAPLGSINVGVVGPREALSQVTQWLQRLESPIDADPGDSLLFPSFPGFSGAFRSTLQMPDALRRQIPEEEVQRVLDLEEPAAMVNRAAALYVSRVAELVGGVEPRPAVVVCAISQDIEDHCWSAIGSKPTPARTKAIRVTKRLHESGQLQLTDFIPDEELVPVVETHPGGTSLRALIKAGAMQCGIPTQLLRESTVSGGRTVQPLGTLAWNFAVGLYYKAGGFPWRLSKVDETTCFIGISFYREKVRDPITMGTAVAQVFDQTGEGLILKGERLQWVKEERFSPHMSNAAATKLGKDIQAAFEKRPGNPHPPSRLVFHKTSRFWPEEIAGLKAALGGTAALEFLAVEASDIRLVRDGQYPPLRGTCAKLGPREYLIYGMGYIPYLNTYPGHHVPKPIHVLEHIGESAPEVACRELLGLTKLNWNTSQFCCGVPITVNIARKVSAVLAELKSGDKVEPSYRFYM